MRNPWLMLILGFVAGVWLSGPARNLVGKS